MSIINCRVSMKHICFKRWVEELIFIVWILSTTQYQCTFASENETSNSSTNNTVPSPLPISVKYNLGDYNLPNFQDYINIVNPDVHMRKNKSSVRFKLHTAKCPEAQRIKYHQHEQTNISQTCFNNSLDVKILIHGFYELGWTVNSMIPIRNAYLRMKTEANVIMVDWSRHAVDIFYLNSVKHLEEIGHQLSYLVNYLRIYAPYTNMSNIHIIGFSLGAHIGGLAGRRIFEMTGQKVGRITSLDAAGPKFFSVLSNDRIRLTDALFIDVIHADVDTYGGNFQGHANFYPNGGRKQPGCSSILNIIIGCGHRKAPRWFTDSILEPRKFIACRCPEYEMFLAKNCTCNNRDELAFFGEHCSHKARGTYFLTLKYGETSQLELGIYPNSISLGFSAHVQNNGALKNLTVKMIGNSSQSISLQPTTEEFINSR